MSNPEVDCVVQEAYDLMGNVRSGDHRLEEVLRRAHAINEKLSCMREYQRTLNSLNLISANGERRQILLGELQRENKQIMAYQEENRVLKEAVEECVTTLSVIMNRHRALMSRIAKDGVLPSADEIVHMMPCHNRNYSDGKEKFRKFALELSEYMKQGEVSACADLEQMTRLSKENLALREMLRAADISNPGAVRLFQKTITSLLEKKKKVNDDDDAEEENDNMDSGADTSAEDDILNTTVLEVKLNESAA